MTLRFHQDCDFSNARVAQMLRWIVDVVAARVRGKRTHCISVRPFSILRHVSGATRADLVCLTDAVHTILTWVAAERGYGGDKVRYRLCGDAAELQRRIWRAYEAFIRLWRGECDAITRHLLRRARRYDAKVSIHVPRKQYDMLAELARERGVSISELIRAALSDFLRRYGL